MKKNKVVKLVADHKTSQKPEEKYSSLIEKFISPFVDNLNDFEHQEEIFDFVINAWNYGNLKSIFDKDEFKEIISVAKEDDPLHFPLLKKMVKEKTIKYKEFTDFIVDFDIKVNKDSISFKVKTAEEDDYMLNLLTGTISDETVPLKSDFEENYINRSAIALKPLQPFIDWQNTIYPDATIDENDLKDINIYLINNASYEDVDTYLKKKFDKYFMMELEGWHTDKRNWPQRRNYKMFKNWFQVNISTAVFDLEKTPISKSE